MIDDRHQVASNTAGLLRRGLTACSSLHGFRFELRHKYFNSLVDEDEIRKTLAFGIELGVEIASSLNAKELAHLSFCYMPFFYSHRDLQDIHNIDFSKLRNIHRPFSGLRSLTLDTYSDAGGPEESHLRTQLIAGIRGKLEGFNGILYHNEPGAFFRCDEPSCAWTSKGKLNEYLTLHREVFRNYWAER